MVHVAAARNAANEATRCRENVQVISSDMVVPKAIRLVQLRGTIVMPNKNANRIEFFLARSPVRHMVDN